MPNEKMCAKEGYHPFQDDYGLFWGSFEVFWDDDDQGRNFDKEGQPVKAGWYWWSCFPGCVPDSDAYGPFDTSQQAFDDARQP